jgi:tRNA (guanine-N7-)-methyltransferase
LPILFDLQDASQSDPALDWGTLFGNDNPVQVELGIGKGRFLIDAAQRHPTTNYLGVEWASKYLKIAHQRCLKRELLNIRLTRADAREFVEFFVVTDSTHAVHIYFPDPWPKKRHYKRRLVNPAFVAEIARILSPGGRLWLATDHLDYFQAMEEALSTCSRLRQTEEIEWDGVRTNYEDKFLARGVKINRMVLEKVC